MKVEKYVKAKTEIDYFFVKGNLDIDVEHYIKKIEEAPKVQHNSDIAIVGLMTDWKYFLNDKKFFEEIMIPIFDLLEESFDNSKYLLCDAWGFKHNFSEYTKEHDHFPGFVSGAVMLSEHPQSLIFPKLNEQLDSKPGNFCIFSSFIRHKSKRNSIDKPRYGLSFNLE